MPVKLNPGTPSISAGSTTPCQWIELVVGKVLRTRSVTVSPSRQCSVGAGRLPLTTVAIRAAPVKLTRLAPMLRSNSVPARTGTWGAAPLCPIAANASDGRSNPVLAATLPSARPSTKRRREGKASRSDSNGGRMNDFIKRL